MIDQTTAAPLPDDESCFSDHSCSHVVPPSQFSLKLKPCPFCGSEPQLRECPNPEDKGYYICCLCFPVQISVETLLQPTAEAAAAEWNTRAENRSFQLSQQHVPFILFAAGSFLFSVGAGFNGGLAASFLSFGAAVAVSSLFLSSIDENLKARIEHLKASDSKPVLRRDLPSCSLCGEVPSLYKTVSGRFRVQCSDSRCWGSARKRLVHLTEQEAAAAWTEAQKS